MTTLASTEESADFPQIKPGAQLALVRAQKGYSLEYVAGKLHLRVRVIELLEVDDYQRMPEPVFVKGYLRAYAKLLDVPHQPLLDHFNRLYTPARKPEKALLWQQTRRETNKAEHAVRWFTTIFALIVLIAVGVWWQANKGNEPMFATNVSSIDKSSSIVNQSETEIRLTDLSKMRSLLSSTGQDTLTETENAGG
jgi:cytoskeleton protein RodZ